jgi:hypothetical protein
MKFMFLLLCCAMTSVQAHEKELRTRADGFATAAFAVQRQHPWPFPLISIGHNMQSYQDYGGSPYWHDGLDIRSNIDQPISAAAGGVVVNIENYVRGNPLYWEVAIRDDQGFVWKYHHVDRGSIPEEILSSLKTGDRIPAGALIGNVVRWGVTTFGERYHHLHLLVVAKDGLYVNPFLLLEPLADTTPPVINRVGIHQNHRPLEATEVRGSHGLFVEASDLTLHDKFILPPYKITYRINQGEERLLWEFIHLPGGTSDTLYINDFYLDGTCGNYQCRRFYFNLTFTKDDPRGKLSLPPGQHTVDVTVEDIVGNRTSESFRWRVL